jgi:Flp pilus assembly protein TadG
MRALGGPRATDERGVALIEFALILPVFMCLILGMFTGGILANRQLEVTHAAREGARYGSMLPVDQIFVSGTWASNVRDVVVERSDGQLTAGQVCVALVTGDTPVPITVDHTTQGDGSACFDDSDESPLGRRVQVTATTSGTLEAFFFTKSVELSAQVTARYEELS